MDWNDSTKFVECDIRDGGIAAYLLEQGCTNYLAASPDAARIEKLIDRCPALEGRLSRTNDAAPDSNGDVVILSGSSSYLLWSRRKLKHVRYIAWSPGISWHALASAPAWLARTLERRYVPERVFVCRAGRWSRRLVFVSRNAKWKQRKTRRFIPHHMGVKGFFERLRAEKVSYAVLRWFESLPAVAPGEDIDMLVADEDTDAMCRILDEGPGVQPVDVYSASGLPFTDYRSMAYFPPYIANRILSGAVMHRNVCMVPTPEHHFLSMAFHALYHKGEESGIPAAAGAQPSCAHPEHDYPGILGRMAAELGIEVEMNMEALDALLDDRGWKPPVDTLARLAAYNHWLVASLGPAAQAGDAGLAVFVLRRRAVEAKRHDAMIAEIEQRGFDILEVKHLSDEESKHAAQRLRGGNWERGPYPTTGGPPAVAVVVYDAMPLPMKRRKLRKFPNVRNARLLGKDRLRDEFNQDLPPEEHCNVVHTCDNGTEAWHYIDVLMPERADAVRQAARDIEEAFATGEPALRDLSRKTARARIELVDFEGRPAVRKTFKPGRERFLEREILAMKELRPKCRCIPPLLNSDAHSVTFPFYDDTLRFRTKSGRLFPLRFAIEAMGCLRDLYEAGYAAIDAQPGNFLVDRNEGLKMIDFEFLYRYEEKPATFEESYDLAGCPDGFDGDVPRGGSGYDRRWRSSVGLSLHSLLHDPAWLQHAKRTLYVLRRLPQFTGRRLKSAWHTLRRRYAGKPVSQSTDTGVRT